MHMKERGSYFCLTINTKRLFSFGRVNIINQLMPIIPIIVIAVTRRICKGFPSINKAGWKTKRKGIIKDTRPKRTASKPTEVGLAPAIPAAAKEATATGGVIAEIIEK